MSYEAVNFYTLSARNHEPLSGVVVKIYSEDGSTFFTQAVTDADGLAGFLLDTVGSYQARFYKFQVQFSQPQLFSVVVGLNEFDVLGTDVSRPTALDAHFCRASGFFRRPDGAPAKHIDLHLMAKFKPLLLAGSGVLTERLLMRTDAKGYLELDLIRNGQYDVLVQGLEDLQRCITVPDAPSVNLPDLLFPVVSEIRFSPEGPYALTVGSRLTLTPSVWASDANLLEGTAPGDVRWSSSDETVASVQVDSEGTLTLIGLAAGTATIQAERLDVSIIQYPDPGITFLSSAAITVS